MKGIIGKLFAIIGLALVGLTIAIAYDAFPEHVYDNEFMHVLRAIIRLVEAHSLLFLMATWAVFIYGFITDKIKLGGRI